MTHELIETSSSWLHGAQTTQKEEMRKQQTSGNRLEVGRCNFDFVVFAPTSRHWLCVCGRTILLVYKKDARRAVGIGDYFQDMLSLSAASHVMVVTHLRASHICRSIGSAATDYSFVAIDGGLESRTK